jgi:hypothetical protein
VFSYQKVWCLFQHLAKPDENGNSTEKYDWTSLMGTDKKKVLEKLPDTFPDFLPPDTVDTVTQIWKVFNINLEE